MQNSIQAAWEPWQKKICTTQTKNFKNTQGMIEGKLTDRIYHGCYTRYANGERRLIDFEKGERCICATKNPFWKWPLDDKLKMQTRRETKNRQLIKGPVKYVHKNLQ